MGLTRRHVLQGLGLALTAWGGGDRLWSHLTHQYQTAMAQPARRKLALLIGINQYPEQVCDVIPAKGSVLDGCLTDVQLQHELLIHRFGFDPNDIAVLTDAAATREAIETTFVNHLINQARPGDIVVFHFSGLGSRMQIEGNPTSSFSLVPVNGWLPTEDQPTLYDLPIETLGLLLRSLRTENVTTILDTSYAYSDPLLRRGLKVRSRPTIPQGTLDAAELQFQEQLLTQLQVSRDQITTQWQTGQLPGVVLCAARPEQPALEGQWNGFSAGLLTYALTQQLWWAAPETRLRISLSRTSAAIQQRVGTTQQPRLLGQRSQDQALTPYYSPAQLPSADGVVTALEDDGQVAQIWLAGLPAFVLDDYGIGSVLAIAPPAAMAPAKEQSEDVAVVIPSLVQVRSRNGLTVRTRLCCGFGDRPQIGSMVQEVIRTIPHSIDLTVALDNRLERIERVDATSAFATIPKVSAIAISEQSADYLFGKLGDDPTVTASLALADPNDAKTSGPVSSNTIPPTKASYGLFNLGDSVIPGSVSTPGEAIKTVINHLTPKLQTLLANKLVRLTANRGSSRLSVRATLEMTAPQERIVAQQDTVRSPLRTTGNSLAALFAGEGQVPILPLGSRIRFRLQNYGDRPLYWVLLGLDSSGNAITVTFPSTTSGVPSPGELPAGDTILVPQSSAGSDWSVAAPPGVVETHLVISREPFKETRFTLKPALIANDDSYHMTLLQNPLEVAQALLSDLHQASIPFVTTEMPSDMYALSVEAWTTFSFTYQVVA